MSLGDFFTLTEMKDGLSTLLRVEELVASMQKEKDCSLNLVGDGTRQQWSAVVETLAATENKDCLNHFVQLNGLCFLNQWLQEYQKCDMDAAEGLIDSLLATLEKLPHDREKLILSGIGITVENLIGHRNLTIKEKAKNLSDKWNDTGTNDASCHDLGDPDTSHNDQPKPPPADANVRTDDANYEVETTGVEDVKLSVSDQPMPTTTGGDAGVGGDVNSVGSSRISNSCPDSVYRAVPDGTEEMEVKVAGTEQGSSPCKSSRKESGDASSSSSSSSSSDLSASSPSSSVGDTKGSQGEPISSPIAEETKAIESGLGLEYEEIDALEMARQVALEVEREVVNSREPFCSSPEVNSGETEDKQDQPLIQDLDSNTLPIEKDHPSDDASSPEHKQSVDSPKKGPVFDLNEAVCTEEFDCSMQPAPITPANLSAPKAVVATSRGAPNLPATPLQFEGEMGWKGSAATSAFRPASPRRTPGPKEKKNFLDFDLNDVAVDPVSMKQTPPVSCGLPSGDSSVEVSSRRAERLKLDLNLNRLGDEDVSMNNTPYPYWRIHHQNGDQSVSSASSSSPRQQPSMRDFDLNDNPSFFDKSSSKASTTTYASPKDPVITIMESRMGGVERKDYLSQAHQPFLGNMEAMMSARPMMPYYSHMPPPYGYSGHPGGHVPTMPIHPSFYGHGAIPYMVEAPQVLGPTGMNGAYYGRPPFLTSVAGAPVSMNGLVRPAWSGLDLNSCMSPIENSGPRDGGSFKQPMFMHGHNGLMEEQQRISSQPAAGSGKRKEPECGWEPYPLGYKQVTSWL